MRERKQIFFITGLLIVVLFVVCYWIYWKEPKTFLTEQNITKVLNEREFEVKTIQDTIFLDKRHVIVPFITEDNKYGLSYWEWRYNEWKIRYGSSTGAPQIVKLDVEQPSTYYFVWNIPPTTKLDSINFYFLKERNYLVSNGNSLYQPGIYMQHSLNLSNKTYGILKLPEEWTSYLAEFNKYDESILPDPFFSSFTTLPTHYFGWMPVGVNEKDINLQQTLNGNSFSSGEGVEHVMLFGEADLKRFQ